MKIAITGGTGFVGQALTKKLLAMPSIAINGAPPQRLSELVIIDHVPSSAPIADARVRYQTADITDPEDLRRVIDGPVDVCVHLAAIVSANAEADFDLGWSVNVDGTRNLLEILRDHGNRPRTLFASSLAVFGGDMPATVDDGSALWPQTSYGAQKATGELMVADYARKGFIDGFSLRLPTVVVRPGKPNKAASTFASSIIREPLKGEEAICPVDPKSAMFIASPRSIVDSFIHAIGIESAKVGANRAMVLPGMTVAIGDMVAALRDVAGDTVADRVAWEPDPVIQSIVSGWAYQVGSSRAEALGFPKDSGIQSIIRAHIEDHG